jgi:hypothetical protein
MKLYEFFSVPSIGKDGDGNETYGHDTKAERQRLANDIYWFILDHDHLHKKHFFPIAQEIYELHKANKDIDRKKYTECWMPMVKEGCMAFYKEEKLKGDPKKLFDKEFCKSICERIAERHIKDITKGEYKLGA